jgi:hypothetical protein
MSGENGNGKKKAMEAQFNAALEQKDEKKKKLGKRTRLGADRMAEVGVIAAFIVQRLRKPTFDEIMEAVSAQPPKGLYASIHKNTMKRALEGLKKAKFVTDSSSSDEKGIGRQNWSMRTAWPNTPEMMAVDSLLKVLSSSPEAEVIMSWFNSQEDQGTKKDTYKGPCEAHFFRVTIITTDMLTGSQPDDGEVFNIIRDRFPGRIEEENIPVKNYWDRDEATGLYRMSPDVLQGWFGNNISGYFKVGRWWGELIAFKPILFKPHTDPVQVKLPCTGGKSGQNAGPQFYEAIMPGQEFVIEFTAPTKRYLTPAQLEAYFVLFGARPKRGLSPSRGRKLGRFAVIKFEDLGAVDGMSTSMILNDIPEWVREKHGEYYADFVRRVPNFTVQQEEFEAGPAPLTN